MSALRHLEVRARHEADARRREANELRARVDARPPVTAGPPGSRDSLTHREYADLLRAAHARVPFEEAIAPLVLSGFTVEHLRRAVGCLFPAVDPSAPEDHPDVSPLAVNEAQEVSHE